MRVVARAFVARTADAWLGDYNLCKKFAADSLQVRQRTIRAQFSIVVLQQQRVSGIDTAGAGRSWFRQAVPAARCGGHPGEPPKRRRRIVSVSPKCEMRAVTIAANLTGCAFKDVTGGPDKCANARYSLSRSDSCSLFGSPSGSTASNPRGDAHTHSGHHREARRPKLIVKSRDGQQMTIVLAPDFTVQGVAKRSFADIKARDYVASTSVKGTDGKLQAFEIHIFPEAMRGVGEGQHPWDLVPDAVMTNATVSGITAAPQGHVLR